MYKKAICIVFMILMLQPFFVQSQEELPLLQMLEKIPTYQGVTGEDYNPIYYVDRRAAEMSRPGVIPLNSLEEFDRYVNSESQADKDVYYLWEATVPGVSNSFRSQMGIDAFRIDRYLFFGDRLSLGVMLEGEFNDSSITEALLEAYNMEKKRDDSYTLWCYIDGCEENGKGTNNANILWKGSNKTQPVLLTQPYLISTQSFSLLQQIINTSQGNENSLAEEDIFRASIEAVTLRGNLIQASFYYSNVATSNNQSSIAVLPEYRLFTLAHVADGAYEFVIVAMVYDTEEKAQQAVEVVEDRIASYRLEITKRDLVDVMEMYGFTDTFKTVHQSQLTDLWVGQFVFRGDLPSSEPNPDVTSNNNLTGKPRFKFMGLFYKQLFNSAIQGDMNWMATGR